MPAKSTKKTVFQEEAEKVLRALRHEIYSGLRLPRERLVENSLAETFRVSRMVIRHALSQLASHGLVEIEPYKGATVAAISSDRIHECYQVLSMLEGFAAMLAVERFTQKDLQQLRKLLEKHRNIDVGNVKEWQVQNHSFHRTINLRCGNQKLIDMIHQNAQFTTYWFLLLSVPGRIPKNTEEHAAIIDAITQGDGQKARQLMERHIMGAGEDLMEHLKKNMPIGFLL